MKTAKALLGAFIIAGLTLPQANAEPENYQLDDHGISFSIEVVKMPIFPRSLKAEGYASGIVKLALEIDNDGELRDWIVEESTHPDFVDSIARVIDHWRFSPPYINGENRSVVTHLNVDFTARCSIISLDMPTSLYSVRMNEITGFNSQSSRLAHPGDLDARPYPVAQPSPKIPGDVIRENKGARAVFTFYVDESGQVRIPSLSQTDGNPDVGMLLAAQEALAQWRFEPPTVKNRPVKIKLAQAFVFNE